MGRKPLPPGKLKKPFTLLLDGALRDALERSATAHELAIGDEIRRRLWASLGDEKFDEWTRRLGHEVKLLAHDVQNQTGHSWREHPKSHETLAAAITTTLERNKPEPVEGEDAWGADDPKTLGRAIARARVTISAERERYHAERKFSHEVMEPAVIKFKEQAGEFYSVLTPKQRKKAEAALKKRGIDAGPWGKKP
jgi:hypothetical protein